MFGTEYLKILKSIAKDQQIPGKLTEYKLLELKTGNAKLLGITKYNQAKLVLVVFAFCFYTKLALNHIKQA